MKLVKLTLLLITILMSVTTLAYADAKTRIVGPTVSPDGSRVAFVVSQEKPQLCFLDLGSKEIQRVQTPAYRLEAFYGMSWDPKGRFIVVTIVEGTRQNIGSWSIWKVSVPEGKSEKIGEIAEEICQRGLVSPDGKNVLFRIAGKKDLVSVDLESKKRRFLTKCGDVYRLGYDWSSGANKIYFSRGYMADKDSIWVMNSDGSQKMLISDKFQAYSLSISPTGKYMAFTVRGGKKENYKNELFVSALQNFNPVRISQDSAYLFDWSPDNDALAYYGSDTRIRVWRPSTKLGSKGVVREIGEGHCPVWAENGEAILFIRNEIELWKYDLNSGSTKRIFAIKK